jgi:hypothetical protein
MKAIRYHVPDAGTYSDQTNSVWCTRCQRRIGSELWEQTCPGLPGGVEFDHLFGGEGANHPGGRMVPAESAGHGPQPSLNETRPPSPSSPSHTEDA